MNRVNAKCPFRKGQQVRPLSGMWKGDLLTIHGNPYRGFDGSWWVNVTDSPRPKAHSWPMPVNKLKKA